MCATHTLTHGSGQCLHDQCSGQQGCALGGCGRGDSVAIGVGPPSEGPSSSAAESLAPSSRPGPGLYNRKEVPSETLPTSRPVMSPPPLQEEPSRQPS